MSKNKYAINDKFQSTADYRLQVIAPLLHLKPENKIQKTEYQNKLKGISSDTGVSVRTLKRWLKNYSEKGIAGLNTKYPKIRTDNKLYIKFESLLDEAKAMRLQSPTISVNEIIACLEGRYPDLSGILKRSTLQEHLSKNGYGRNDQQKNKDCSDPAQQELNCNSPLFLSFFPYLLIRHQSTKSRISLYICPAESFTAMVFASSPIRCRLSLS